MKTLKKVTSAPKRLAFHVYNHRGSYGFAAGIIAGGYAIRNLDNETYKEAIAFIKYKELSDEFFNPTEHDWQDMV